MSDQKDSSGGQASAQDDLLEKIEKLKQAELLNSAGSDVADGSSAGGSELDALKSAKEEAEERAMRALAELQNAKRRMEEEKRSFAAFANQSLILEVLNIVQSFNLSVGHLPEILKGDEWVKGVLLIDQQLNALLERRGVVVIECKVGDKVDPLRHEAVMQASGVSGTVVAVLEKGYEMNGRVLKAVKVTVGNGN